MLQILAQNALLGSNFERSYVWIVSQKGSCLFILFFGVEKIPDRGAVISAQHVVPNSFSTPLVIDIEALHLCNNRQATTDTGSATPQ